MTPIPENPGDRYVLVPAELLAQLQRGWSLPMRIRVTSDDGHELSLVAELAGSLNDVQGINRA